MQDSDRDVYDITIIGGGPVGLFAAFYAGLRAMRTKVIDSHHELGGQLAALYPDKFVYDVGGFPAVLARTLAAELTKQAMQYRPTVVLGQQVEGVRNLPGGLIELETESGPHCSRSVIVAAGGGAFTPKRLAGPIGAYEGRGLHYGVRDPWSFRGKRTLVIGGGDSAVDWALALSGIAASVTLIHRGERFRAMERSMQKVLASPVTLRTYCELKNLAGDQHVERATIIDNRTREEEALTIDDVLVNVGFTSTLGPVRRWGLRLDEGGVAVGSRMETSMPGVYAAGDIASYPGKLKLIATGFGEAATAVNHAKACLAPTERVFPGHSTTLVPKLRRLRGLGEGK
jgi:ferredoxin/flavodoxin---NADP+ reductase